MVISIEQIEKKKKKKTLYFILFPISLINYFPFLQFIYLLSYPNGTMKLYQFIVIFGVFMLFLAQIPSFHSLRHINLVSLILCLAFTACATAGSIYIGKNTSKPQLHAKQFLVYYARIYTQVFDRTFQERSK